MGRKYYSTGTVTLTDAGNNTVIAAPAAGTEIKIRRLWLERVDVTDVTVILENNAAQVRELFPRVTLNSDAGKMFFDFDDQTEIGVGDGLACVLDASVGAKVRAYIEYRFGTAISWPL